MEHVRITRIQVFPQEENKNTLGYAHVTLSDAFVVKNLRLVKGKKGVFIGMPSYRLRNGDYADVFFPVSREARTLLTNAIIDAFRREYPEILDGLQVYEAEAVQYAS
ncbi:MAG: putative septation protein SpoVG [Turneriella sp.]|nr:putative septation protein SpoVG [Turneriella sp.]